MVVVENIFLNVTNTRNYIAWEASVGKIPALLIFAPVLGIKLPISGETGFEIAKGPRHYCESGLSLIMQVMRESSLPDFK